MKIIIIGGGQVGCYIANLLIENGNSVIVIENKEKRFRHYSKTVLKKRIFWLETALMLCFWKRQE